MSELLELALRVAGCARGGEQVGVYAASGRDTVVVVYDGDVESLSSAASAGVGIRVIRDQRQGFAYAGSLDEDVVTETLAEARDNAAFGTPDEYLGLAVPHGFPAADLGPWPEELAAAPTARTVS